LDEVDVPEEPLALEEDDDEPPSELGLDFESVPDEDLSPDSLLWAFLRASEG